MAWRQRKSTSVYDSGTVRQREARTRQSLAFLGALHGDPTQPLGVTEKTSPRAKKRPSTQLAANGYRLERYEQKDFVRWCATVPILEDSIVGSGNAGKRNVIQATEAKRMGLCPGAADLFIALPVGASHGLWMEFKQARHYPPHERAKAHMRRQEAFLERMKQRGYAAEFAFGFEDGVRIATLYLEGKL